MQTDHIIALISKIRTRANKIIIRELHDRNMEGLSPSHGDILFFLFGKGSASMTELAGKIDRDKSTVTALVKKLIAHGYVTTAPDTQDSRVTVVSLTEKGWETKPDFDAISKVLLDRTWGSCSAREKEVMVLGLENILRNM
jgi:MarR family transcriptional regulator, organic hydroperoxide resistance regulator